MPGAVIDSRLAALGVALLLAAALQGSDSAAGPAWPLGGQVRLLAGVNHLRVETMATHGPYSRRSVLLRDGANYRYESLPTASALKPPQYAAAPAAANIGPLFEYHPFAGFIGAITPKLGSRLDLSTGRMEIFAPAPAPAGQPGALHLGDIPFVLLPLRFLAITEHELSASQVLDWSDLTEATLSAAWKRNVTGVDTLPDGRLVAHVPLKGFSEADPKSLIYDFFGDEWRVTISAHSEFAGVRLVDGMELINAHSKKLQGVWTYTYAAVQREGEPAVPLLNLMEIHAGDRTSLQWRERVTRCEVGKTIPSSEFAIDPTLAKSIFDADTRMPLTPEALGGGK